MQKIYAFLYHFLWITPFMAFLLGYHLVKQLSYISIIPVPNIIGYHIHDAIITLSKSQLNARILSQKEDQELPEGLVISQTPANGKKIKSQQSVFLVVTRRPAKPLAPKLINLSLSAAQKKAQELGIALKPFFISSVAPQNSCIAQNIEENRPVTNGEVIAYFSAGTNSRRIMPNFKNKLLLEVTDFLKTYGIGTNIIHSKYSQLEQNHECAHCEIIAQRPVAGSIIDLQKQLTMQFVVKKQTH